MTNAQKKALFIADYIKFISQLGQTMNSLQWWATWLASKDAFVSSANSIFESVFLYKKKAELEFSFLFFVSEFLRTLKPAMRMMYSLFILSSQLKVAERYFHQKYKGLKIDVVKTFGFLSSFENGKFKDPYLPLLSDFLCSENKRPVLTVYDYSGPIQAVARLSVENESALSLQSLMRWWDIPRAYCLILRGLVIQPPQSLIFCDQEIGTLVRNMYRRDLLSYDAIYSFCVYYAFLRLARLFDIQSIVMTYENHPWERMAISAIRKAKPSTYITSYQHSVVNEAMLNMYPGKDEVKFAPVADQVLTVGEVTAQSMNHYGHYGKVPVTPACALRFSYLHSLPVREVSVPKVLLVALSGIVRGAELLDYVLAQAHILQDWKIIIREHPALTIADLSYRNRRDYKIESFMNIEVSRGRPLVDDLHKSKVVLYHSSTIALEALQMGIPVIYYDDRRFLSFDPAQDCPYLHWQTDALHSLAPLLIDILKVRDEDRIMQAEQARQFVARYFYPVTPESLKKFVV